MEPNTRPEEWQFVETLEKALRAWSLGEFTDLVLPGVADMLQAEAAFLYISTRLPRTSFFHYGLSPKTAAQVDKQCEALVEQVVQQGGQQPIPLALDPNTSAALYPLVAHKGCVGLLGITAPTESDQTLQLLNKLINLLGPTICRLVEHERAEQQLAHLNIYLTISSMLAQSMDLHELLEITLVNCKKAVSAEAASVLLLDRQRACFYFYHIASPGKLVLEEATFSADKGIAGAVLQSGKSVVINDVHKDPHFYTGIDSQTGFQTRNMIAIPLVAGEEKIGALEVLNKAEGGAFTEEEHVLLRSIANEIAFAIRNAIVFEQIVDTYRQKE